MAQIENVKSYYGNDMETIILRPLIERLQGEVKILLNYPSDKVSYWKRNKTTKMLERYTIDVLKEKYCYNGGVDADDYFAHIYTYLTSHFSIDNLTGEELERAEIEYLIDELVFDIRNRIMYNENGFFNKLNQDEIIDNLVKSPDKYFSQMYVDYQALGYFDKFNIKDLRFYVSNEVFQRYGNLNHCMIPIINCGPIEPNFMLLTPYHNLVLNIDTSQSEVRMWYDPDTMQNKQRVRFDMGYDVLNPDFAILYINN